MKVLISPLNLILHHHQPLLIQCKTKHIPFTADLRLMLLYSIYLAPAPSVIASPLQDKAFQQFFIHFCLIIVYSIYKAFPTSFSIPFCLIMVYSGYLSPAPVLISSVIASPVHDKGLSHQFFIPRCLLLVYSLHPAPEQVLIPSLHLL